MQTPLQITFRHVDHSPALEARIRELAARLEKRSADILHCHVIVEGPPRHQHQGGLYQVHVDLTIPGSNLAVRRSRPIHRSHEDAYVALRDAFRAVRRRLQDAERRRQPPAKTRVGPPRGRVCELHREAGFGRIETDEGRLLYFHRASVRDGTFDDLSIGAEVRFDEEAGDQGPQASTVRLMPRARMH